MFDHYLLRLKPPQPSGTRACLRLQAGREEGECILVYHNEKSPTEEVLLHFILQDGDISCLRNTVYFIAQEERQYPK